MRVACGLGLLVVVMPAAAVAAAPDARSCLDALAAAGVDTTPAQRKGIDLAVEVRGPVGGLTLAHDGPLVLDCSLVVSLVEAAPSLRALGIETVTISSGYARRFVRGTRRRSRHSFGLAVDVSVFAGAALGRLRVAQDYEQGLGDTADCLGQPITEGGATLRAAACALVASGLFRTVLTPDYDDAHHDHFHLEARPWRERAALRDAAPSIH